MQEETLDESWIPVTEKEWREQQDSENEHITKKVNPCKFGHEDTEFHVRVFKIF